MIDILYIGNFSLTSKPILIKWDRLNGYNFILLSNSLFSTFTDLLYLLFILIILFNGLWNWIFCLSFPKIYITRTLLPKYVRSIIWPLFHVAYFRLICQERRSRDRIGGHTRYWRNRVSITHRPRERNWFNVFWIFCNKS